MPLEIKYFELNGMNLVPFTNATTDSQEPETGTMPNLGDENRQFAEDDRGSRTITWEGYIGNDEIYLNLRKTLFNSEIKTLKLHPDRKIVLQSLGFRKRIDVKEPDKSSMIITMLAADTREYNVTQKLITRVISSSPGTVPGVAPTGNAPTTPEWTIVAIGEIVNPVISNGTDSMEWYGSLNQGDTMIISKDGLVSVNNTATGNVSGAILEALPGTNTFTFSDDPSSSHNCTITVKWNDAYY